MQVITVTQNKKIDKQKNVNLCEKITACVTVNENKKVVKNCYLFEKINKNAIFLFPFLFDKQPPEQLK